MFDGRIASDLPQTLDHNRKHARLIALQLEHQQDEGLAQGADVAKGAVAGLPNMASNSSSVMA